jgi:inorganic pyrophosphatase
MIRSWRSLATDPLFQDYHDILDIPQHLLRGVARFSAVCRDLKGRRMRTLSGENADQATARILRAIRPYPAREGSGEL